MTPEMQYPALPCFDDRRDPCAQRLSTWNTSWVCDIDHAALQAAETPVDPDSIGPEGQHDVDPVNQIRPFEIDRTAVTLYAAGDPPLLLTQVPLLQVPHGAVNVHCASTGILASRTQKSWPYGSDRTVSEQPQGLAESKRRRTMPVSALR